MSESIIVTELSEDQYDKYEEEFKLYAAESGLDREFEYQACDPTNFFHDWLRTKLGTEFEVIEEGK